MAQNPKRVATSIDEDLENRFRKLQVETRDRTPMTEELDVAFAEYLTRREAEVANSAEQEQQQTSAA